MTPATRARIIIAVVLISSCVGCDQATKSIATDVLKDSPPRAFCSDTVCLVYAQNPGGFLSLGGNMPDTVRQWVFVGFNSCMMLGLATFLIINRRMPLVPFIAIAFTIAGGIGNLIDRVFNNGLVTDFIILDAGFVRTGVFNVADMAVLLGAGLLGLHTLQSDGHKRPDEPGQAVT